MAAVGRVAWTHLPAQTVEGTVLLPRGLRSESLETDWFSSECTGAFWWLQMCHWTEHARSEPAGGYVVCGHVTCSRNSQGDLSAGSSITARSFSVSSGSHAHATMSPVTLA